MRDRVIICGLEVTDKDIERLYDKFEVCEDGCWRWTANRTATKNSRRKRDGYGRFWMNKVGVLAHKFIYEWLRGPIPEGRVLDHICNNTLCVNPDHLEPKTNKENVLRGIGPAAINAAKTHCDHGHEFTEENTYVYNGGRSCRACHRERSREWWREKRGVGRGADHVL